MNRVIYQNLEYDVASLAITKRLNNADTATLRIPEPDVEVDFGTDLISIYSDNDLLFSGYLSHENPQNTGGNNSITLEIESKLIRIKWAETGIITINNQSIVDVLNTANTGIIFKDYNLSRSEVNINYRSISYKTANQKWWDFLTEFSVKLGFFFWYDYSHNCCYLGEPDKEIIQTNESFLYGKASSCEPPALDYTTIINHITALGGGVSKATIQYASDDVIQSGGYPILTDDGVTYYIEDAESIAKYGKRSLQFNSPDVSLTASDPTSRTAASNLIYSEAVSQLKKLKNPKITIPKFDKYVESNAKNEFGVNSYFTMDFNRNPKNPNSKKIKGKFYINDITHTYDHNSTEGYYTSTLTDSIIRPVQQTILRKYEIGLGSPSPAVINPNYKQTLTFGIEPTGTILTTSQDIIFNLDPNLKKITKFEVGVSAFLASGTADIQASILVDGIDLSLIFKLNVSQKALTIYPSTGKVDILALPVPAKVTLDQLGIITNATVPHKIIITNIADALSSGSVYPATVSFTVEVNIEGEV